MLKVGITGGIGSGKTTVCQIFTTLGIPVYYADIRAKELMISDPDIVSRVKKLLGDQSYHEEGKLNRKLISDKVFGNSNLLNQLNSIVHPAVFQDSLYWFQKHQDKPYTIYEAAIMFESGSSKVMDKMIIVTSPKEVRIARIIQRDKITRGEVLERMDKQLPEEEKIKRADFVIYNDHSQPLIDQVLRIHRKLMNSVK